MPVPVRDNTPYPARQMAQNQDFRPGKPNLLKGSFLAPVPGAPPMPRLDQQPDSILPGYKGGLEQLRFER